MRVYECTPPRRTTLLKNLPPERQDQEFCEFVDVVEDRQGQSARVYAFWRDSAERRSPARLHVANRIQQRSHPSSNAVSGHCTSRRRERSRWRGGRYACP